MRYIDAEGERRSRLIDGAAFTYQTPDRSRTFARGDVLTFILPILIGVLLIVVVLMGRGGLLGMLKGGAGR